MKKDNRRSFPITPTFTAADDGKAVVQVPLSGDTDKVVTVDRADYDALAELGIHEGWFWGGRPDGSGSVRCTLSANYRGLGVARLILQMSGEMQPRPNRPNLVARYRDGNPLNLRRHNLKAAKGRKSRNIERTALEWAYGTSAGA